MKKSLIACALALCALAGGAPARAEQPVRLIVAFPPGGPVDLVGRVLAERLGKALGRQVIVENKAGANGNIGAAFVAKAPADGSVLFLTSVGPWPSARRSTKTCRTGPRKTSRRCPWWSITRPSSW